MSGTCLSSSKGTAGLATSEVSSKKMRVSEKGIAYRNVGSFLGQRGQTGAFVTCCIW